MPQLSSSSAATLAPPRQKQKVGQEQKPSNGNLAAAGHTQVSLSTPMSGSTTAMPSSLMTMRSSCPGPLMTPYFSAQNAATRTQMQLGTSQAVSGNATATPLSSTAMMQSPFAGLLTVSDADVNLAFEKEQEKDLPPQSKYGLKGRQG